MANNYQDAAYLCFFMYKNLHCTKSDPDQPPLFFMILFFWIKNVEKFYRPKYCLNPETKVIS